MGFLNNVVLNVAFAEKIIQVLGLVVFQALDYGLAETEEHNFSTELESLIEYMTTSDTDVESDDSHTVDDEGIVRDGDDDAGEEDSLSSCNFETVLQILQKQRQQVELEALERSDWARLWIQIMKQLRHGVKLKKVDHCPQSFEGEYELTPYEILMKDIVFKRYRLNKIMVNGDIPPKVKHDAHTMILDFIRSRPPLHPVSDC
uniref:KIND domain-containing protein n=1 Tax=Octopus bimaculoides TaxID=37653 RepID=A0A0L8G9A9_OCTBM